MRITTICAMALLAGSAGALEISGAYDVDVASGASQTISEAITGNGSIRKTGAGDAGDPGRPRGAGAASVPRRRRGVARRLHGNGWTSICACVAAHFGHGHPPRRQGPHGFPGHFPLKATPLEHNYQYLHV